jgi:hypothetical protein
MAFRRAFNPMAAPHDPSLAESSQNASTSVGGGNPSPSSGATSSPAAGPTGGSPGEPKAPKGAMRALAAHQLKGGRGSTALAGTSSHLPLHGQGTNLAGAIRRPFGKY